MKDRFVPPRSIGAGDLDSYFLSGHHITPMKTHPHAEATYRVVRLASGTFGVEVVIPDTFPTTVSSFATEAAAEAWIARDKRRVQSESLARRWFRKTDRILRATPRRGPDPTRMD